MSLGMTYSPTIPGGGLQVTNFDQSLHIVMVIGKCTDVFRGILFCLGVGLRGGGYVGGSFLGGVGHGGKKFNEKGVGFSSITIRKQWKINMKTFFQMKGRSCIET